jgi:hypothetical protein
MAALEGAVAPRAQHAATVSIAASLSSLTHHDTSVANRRRLDKRAQRYCGALGRPDENP